jgi:hypothetical protein
LDQTPPVFRDLPSVRRVTAPVAELKRYFWCCSLPPASLENTKKSPRVGWKLEPPTGSLKKVSWVRAPPGNLTWCTCVVSANWV